MEKFSTKTRKFEKMFQQIYLDFFFSEKIKLTSLVNNYKFCKHRWLLAKRYIISALFSITTTTLRPLPLPTTAHQHLPPPQQHTIATHIASSLAPAPPKGRYGAFGYPNMSLNLRRLMLLLEDLKWVTTYNHERGEPFLVWAGWWAVLQLNALRESVIPLAIRLSKILSHILRSFVYCQFI